MEQMNKVAAERNPVMEMAFDYVELTNTIVFLTGKAGTGKTTFLQYVKKHSRKKMAIVAPTGVAAINAGGMTIHSLFQVPFGPIIPSNTAKPEVHFSEEKKELLLNLDLLVIDEVSMVRPDILDYIDLVLRNLKESVYPFGGIQVLLIGDLSQLSPIIRDEEWIMLSGNYNNRYFFNSHVINRAQFVRIELDKVFRQKEADFIDILNQVRNNHISTESLQKLNARFIPGFTPPVDDPYITLTTHNQITRQINNEFLEALTEKEYEFNATIKGDFPKDAYPTEMNLKLKLGAQVMFVKNDTSAEKLFYNGKIGTVTHIESDAVFVRCGNETKLIEVKALEWTNIKYQLEAGEQQINEANAGSFIQIPLKLAWSITIHKSQGLTFEKAIVDVSEAFTHGQVYVALSRCRSLNGMVLRNPVSHHNIIGDPVVTVFNSQVKNNNPDKERLKRDQELYHQFLITELFNFKNLKSQLNTFSETEQINSLHLAFNNLTELGKDCQTEIIDVSDRFIRQLNTLNSEGIDQNAITARIQKAADYFFKKLQAIIQKLHAIIPLLLKQSGSGSVLPVAVKADKLLQWTNARTMLMEHFVSHSFTPEGYMEIKAKVQSKAIADKSQSYVKMVTAKPNEKFFIAITAWRDKLADNKKLLPRLVLSEKTMEIIAEKLPQTIKALGAIKGVGQAKANEYGPDIITIIRTYQQETQSPEQEQGSLF